jgi:hypothetical protein
LVIGGLPSYEAVLVNDTNLNDAAWQPYDGNISLILGPTNGVYQVWIGLKGHAPEAQPTWIGTTVTLNQTAPPVFITSPTNETTAAPYLQVQGYSLTELTGVTYDLSNALVVVTNQAGSITGDYWDTNLLAYTTNYFQCYDIPLTNGLNFISLHCTDLAGNVTTTNLNVTLDYTMAANPSVLLTWPQNGMEICGGSFTVRGWTEDASAQVSATITDANGDTNTISGAVERTGVVWVENLPLNSGTNWVMLSITNAAGLSNATNFYVVQSSMTLALTSIDGNLWFPTVNVSGVISDPTYAVMVNGVQGTNYSNGTWSAFNVPVSSGGVASFDMSATAGGGDPDASTNLDKPTEAVLESAHWSDVTLDDPPTRPEGMDNNYLTGDYSIVSGGTIHEVAQHFDTNGVLQGTGTFDWKYAPDMSFISEHDDYGDGNVYDVTSGEDPLQVTLALGVLSDQADDGYWHEVRTSQVKDVLHIGGKGIAGGQVLVAAGVGSGTEELMTTPFYLGLDFDELTVEGLGKTLGSDGLAYGTAAVGSTVSINLTAPVPYHVFSDDAGVYHPYITANGINLDTNTPEFCVGQQVNFALNGLPSYVNLVGQWNLPGEFVNEPYQYSSTCASYRRDSSLLQNTNTTSCWFINKPGGAVSVGMNLLFANGQTASIAADGSITVYRPTATMFSIQEPRYYTLSNTNLPATTLKLGDQGGDSDNGSMFYKVNVNSKYNGNANFTQLITADYSNPVYIFSVEECDGTEFYNDPSTRIIGSGIIGLGDGPSDTWVTPNIVNLSARDFVRFQPDGGIYVTLGIVTWDTVGTAEQSFLGNWSITTDTTPDPSGPDSSDAFPVWTQSITAH